jgi:gamma-glutamylcyclotransferase (GGCT)/AIG2-like uncharacterized protein YtfP
MKRRYYLAYGSNMNTAQMKFRCPEARVVGAVTLKDFRLLFRGADGCAFATVEPARGESVPALLWLISPADEAALDCYESFPRHYRKEEVKIAYGKRSLSVMTYVMNGGRLGLPSASYLYTILEGYAESGLDVAALDKALKSSARSK